MRVGHLSRRGYKTTALSVPVASIEKQLRRNRFLVVLDQGRFQGMITPADILGASDRLVGDCLGRVVRLDYNDQVEAAIALMKSLSRPSRNARPSCPRSTFSCRRRWPVVGNQRRHRGSLMGAS